MTEIQGRLPPDAEFRGQPTRPPEPSRVLLSVPNESLSHLAMSDVAKMKSPTGFAWGYSGSGPAALAHSILAAMFGDRIADVHFQNFKSQMIAPIDGDRGFIMSAADVADWLRAQGFSVVMTDTKA